VVNATSNERKVVGSIPAPGKAGGESRVSRKSDWIRKKFTIENRVASFLLQCKAEKGLQKRQARKPALDRAR